MLIPVIEELVNRALALDPSSGKKLSAMRGRIVQIRLTGLNYPLFMTTSDDGIHFMNAEPEPVDVTVEGTPLALIQMIREDDPARLIFSGKVVIHGDRDLLHQLKQLFSDLDIDWEELLSHGVGDPLARFTSVKAAEFRHWLENSYTTLRMDLDEWLREETRSAASQEFVGEYQQKVDQVRDGVDRLEKRVQRLAARIRNSHHS